MSILLNAKNLAKAFDSKELFRDLNLVVEQGDRIGLIGPNGSGKSTLLKILAGQIAPDAGEIAQRNGLKISYVEQVPRFSLQATIRSAVKEKLRNPDDLEQNQNLAKVLSNLSLDGSKEIDPDTLIQKLSGGWKKRVALAQALVSDPDLLLLDEPTNHLDVEAIQWLEDLLNQNRFATLTITHDRLFLTKAANRIIELDRRNPNGILNIKGDYTRYLLTKQQVLASQEKQEAKLKNKLEREIAWLQRGARARSTKQKARMKQVEKIRQQKHETNYRTQTQISKLIFSSSEKKPKKLLEAKGLAKSFDQKKIIEEFNFLITPGMRIGLVGANGCGKTTLLRLLLGKESPDQGVVSLSKHLGIAYFEQNRETLDLEKSLMKTISPDGDFVHYQGEPIHVRSYLGRFLFPAAQAKLPVGQLSGGEQSRLMLAKLMLADANLLVLDEPTNDLDIPTLELLEKCLQDFKGAILIVSHDRYFIDQVSNQIVAFPPMGSTDEGKLFKFADLNQWQDWQSDQKILLKRKKTKSKPKLDTPKNREGKLGYLAQREYDQMENKIHNSEAKLAELEAEVQIPENSSNHEKLTKLHTEIETIKKEIELLYERWSELETERLEP